VDEAVELPQAVTEVLSQAFVEVDELAEFFGGGVAVVEEGRALLGGEAGEEQGIHRVGLGAVEVLLSEALGAEGIDHGDAEAAFSKGGHQVLTVVPRGFEGDHRVLIRAEQAEQSCVSWCVFGEGRGLEQKVAGVVDDGDDVGLGADVDSDMAHVRFLDLDNDARPTVPKLVYARTPWGALEIPFGLR
jgi:hypothetical protein